MVDFKKPKTIKSKNKQEDGGEEQKQPSSDATASKKDDRQLPPFDQIPIDPSSEVNTARLKEAFDNVDVFVAHSLRFVRAQKDEEVPLCGAIYFLDDLVNEVVVDLHILHPLLDMGPGPFLTNIEEEVLTAKKFAPVKDFKTMVEMITSGCTVVHIDGMQHAVAVITPGYPTRSVSEPEAEPLVRGPREGFTEKLQDNTALIRKRMRTPDLKSEMIKLGHRSHTAVCLMYIRDLVDDNVLAELHARLDRIDIDVLLESAELEELIEDQVYSPFPQILSTERADKVASALSEGRIAIIIDGTPFVLIVPSVFFDFMQASEDYYQRFYFSMVIRLLRIFTFLISLLGPSLYVAITTFHQELIPTPLLLTVISARSGVPFPALVEALVMEVSFEILREAGVRLPRPVGSAVSIVGALVVGQAAVEAGVISQAMVIVVAFTGIASFTIPAFNLSMSTRLLRFPIMLIAASLGLYGIALALVVLGVHMCSLRSFGVPYMAPVAPTYARMWASEVFVLPFSHRKMRPAYIQTKDIQGHGSNQKPMSEEGGKQ